MNIAFDGIAILGAMSKNRGIGNYTLSQFRTILRQDTENQYFFFNVLEKTGAFTEEIQKGLLQEDDFFCVKDDFALAVPDFQVMYGALIKEYIRKNKIDVFYITSPFDGHLPPYQQEWFEGVQVIATVYDIIPYVMREHYFTRETDMVWYMERVDMLRWADRLLVISQSVKDDLIQYLNFSADSIDVIWGAPGEQFCQIEIEPNQERKLFRKYKINSPYIMCTGGDDERKNIAGLIEAFGRLPRGLSEQYQLVIVCKLQKVSVERYTKLAEQFGIRDRVVLTNFVTDEELLQLYNLAKLVAFPSVYEGFGLPVVEAWACGAPVLTSNNSSLVQIAGDAAILVDPYSIDDIAKGLEEALVRSDLEELVQKGQERLKKFQWSEVARVSISAFSEVFQPLEKHEVKKHRIAFFTPIPPVQSGISDYSVDILWELSKHFDIDVFINQLKWSADVLPEDVRVYAHNEYPSMREQYRDTVYQMGNSTYHVYMWPYLQEYGGTLVLHDYNLHGVAQDEALFTQKNNIELYRTILKEDMTPGEVSAYLNYINRGHAPKINEIELNGFVTNYANKIIVHSQEGKEKLLKRDIGRCVRWIRSYAKIEPLRGSSMTKEILGWADSTLQFAAFGHIHETKRAIPILKAFAKLADQHNNVQLHFVGKLDPTLEPKFIETVNRLHLTDKVHVTGYVTLEEFEQYIDAADICLNLRWPYNGETSGSLMRILAKGKCVIVNDVGSFGEIPDDACVKLPSVEDMTESREVSAICSAMVELADKQSVRESLQKAARRFAEEYLDIRKIAEQYTEFILEPLDNTGVTEKLLADLKQEIKNKQFSEEEVRALARTLAYAK